MDLGETYLALVFRSNIRQHRRSKRQLRVVCTNIHTSSGGGDACVSGSHLRRHGLGELSHALVVS